MKRLILASLVIWLMTDPALAQGSCRSGAQMQRDQCTRQAGANNARSRQCLDNYLTALDRCEEGGYDPVNPPAPRGRADPLNPPTVRSRPVVPQVNPRPRTVRPPQPAVPSYRRERS